LRKAGGSSWRKAVAVWLDLSLIPGKRLRRNPLTRQAAEDPDSLAITHRGQRAKRHHFALALFATGQAWDMVVGPHDGRTVRERTLSAIADYYVGAIIESRMSLRSCRGRSFAGTTYTSTSLIADTANASVSLA
jgi:hypothetical protein